MSTQITLPAPRRISRGRGWMAAVVLAVFLGLAAATFLALRPDGVASSKPGAASVVREAPAYTAPVSGSEIGIATGRSAAAIPNAHNSSGFKRLAAERPGWPVPGSGAGPDGSCGFVGRHAC
jgi:hypothetical protein